MKKVAILAALLVALLYAWSERRRILPGVAREMAPETEAFPKAAKSARQERSRVDETRAVDAADSGKDVNDGMAPDDVRRLWGEPASVDQDPANHSDVWHYPVVHRKVIFRDDRVRSVEPD
jgi:hypothetical protein